MTDKFVIINKWASRLVASLVSYKNLPIEKVSLMSS